MSTTWIIVIVIVVIAAIWWFMREGSIANYSEFTDAVIMDPNGNMANLLQDTSVLTKAVQGGAASCLSPKQLSKLALGALETNCPQTAMNRFISKLPSPPEESIVGGVDLSDPATITKPYINAENRAKSRLTQYGDPIRGDLIQLPFREGTWFSSRGNIDDGTFRKVEHVKIGDQIMGDDSCARNVTALTTGKDMLYRIHQSKGNSYVVNSEHKVSLKMSNSSNCDDIHKPFDMTVKDYIGKSVDFRSQTRGYKIPLNLPDKYVTLPPYIVGYVIGLRLIENDKFNVNKIMDVTADVCKEYRTKVIFFCEYLSFLKSYEYAKPETIPVQFKLNCQSKQSELLAGIIDSFCNSKGYVPSIEGYSFYSKKDKLIQDIAFIAGCLGYDIQYRNDSSMYRLFISGFGISKIPVRSKARIEVENDVTKNHLKSKLFIEEIGVDTYYGFSVDGNHRFLLEDFTVTNNSTVIKDIMYNVSDRIPSCQLFSGTEDSNHSFSDIVHPLYIFDEYDVNSMKSGIMRQKLAMASDCENPKNLTVIEDCMEEPKLFKKPPFTAIMKNGRHWNNLYLFSLQWCRDITPSIRSLMDYIFIGKEDNISTRKRIYDDYTNFIHDQNGIKGFDIFNHLMDKICVDYTWLVVKNRVSDSTDISDKLRFYKAKKRDSFQFGCREYRKWAEERYDPEGTSSIVL